MLTTAPISAFKKTGVSSFRLATRLAHSDVAVTLQSEKHKRYMRVAEVDPDAEFSPTHSAAAKAVARGNRTPLTLDTKPGVELGDLEVEKLMNGLMVASVPTAYPAYHVQLAVKAGPRFEEPWSLGVSHVVRRMFGLASKPFRFAVNQNRTLQQIGAHIECGGTRELLQYQMSHYKFADEAIDVAATAFAYATTMPAIYPWEISRNMPMLRLDLADVRGSTAQVIDQLHAVAFRSGLSNSLWCPEHRMGDISSDTVEEYFNQFFTPDRFALIGIGLPLATVKDLAHKLCFLEPQQQQQDSASGSQWRGGESRIENGNPTVQIALAVKGASVADAEAAAAQTVVAALLSNQLDTVADNGPATVTPLNFLYSDCGLFGLHIVCNYLDAGDVVRGAVSKLSQLKKSGSIDAAAISGAKAAAKREAIEAQLNPNSRLGDLSAHLLLNGSADMAASIEQVTPESVAKQLQLLFGGKLAMTSLGRLQTVPFKDDLQL